MDLNQNDNINAEQLNPNLSQEPPQLQNDKKLKFKSDRILIGIIILIIIVGAVSAFFIWRHYHDSAKRSNVALNSSSKSNNNSLNGLKDTLKSVGINLVTKDVTSNNSIIGTSDKLTSRDINNLKVISASNGYVISNGDNNKCDFNNTNACSMGNSVGNGSLSSNGKYYINASIDSQHNSETLYVNSKKVYSFVLSAADKQALAATTYSDQVFVSNTGNWALVKHDFQTNSQASEGVRWDSTDLIVGGQEILHSNSALTVSAISTDLKHYAAYTTSGSSSANTLNVIYDGNHIATEPILGTNTGAIPTISNNGEHTLYFNGTTFLEDNKSLSVPSSIKNKCNNGACALYISNDGKYAILTANDMDFEGKIINGFASPSWHNGTTNLQFSYADSTTHYLITASVDTNYVNASTPLSSIYNTIILDGKTINLPKGYVYSANLSSSTLYAYY